MILSELFLTDETFPANFDVILSGKPTLDELCEHVDISSKWYKFGVLLKLKIKELDIIRVDYEDDDNIKALKMLELWLSTNPKATRKEIIDVLRKPVVGWNAIAKQYLMALKESELEK